MFKTHRSRAISLTAKILMAGFTCGLGSLGHAQTAPPVFTRALVKSIEDKGDKTFIYLKIPPKSTIPFTIQTFQVPDRKLIEGLAPGDSVGFSAKGTSAGNEIVVIHKTQPCIKFRKCPPPT